jgi:uncharacterized RDD family membrane protein YckC
MGSALLNPPTPDPAYSEVAAHSHASTSNPSDALRLEVAERLAEHRNRRSRLRPQQLTEAAPKSSPNDTRSARIAASVAERFAHTPSYRAFLAAEAERATQQAQAAAEIAALNARAVARAQQQLLESLYPDSEAEATIEPQDQHHQYEEPAHELSLWPEPELDTTTNPGRPSFPASSERVGYRADARQPSTGRRSRPRTATEPAPAPGLIVHLFDAPPLRHTVTPNPNPAARHHPHEDEAESRALDEEITFRQAPVFEEAAGPPMPLPANLIEFPRQLIAPRKVRPRYAEGPLRDDDDLAHTGSQLRIFEVDAAQISTTPDAAAVADAVETSTHQWTSLWLDSPTPAPTATTPDEVATTLAAPYTTAAPRPDPAPISRRLMAAAIDAALVLTAFITCTATFAAITLHATAPPGAPLRELLTLARPTLAELQPGPTIAVATAAIALLYILYQLLFFSLAEATPGMRHARIALCTFTDENPTRRAMRRRILAVLLSACPLGLGFLWATLDEDRLTWHDLISRMYQRSY